MFEHPSLNSLVKCGQTEILRIIEKSKLKMVISISFTHISLALAKGRNISEFSKSAIFSTAQLNLFHT